MSSKTLFRHMFSSARIFTSRKIPRARVVALARRCQTCASASFARRRAEEGQEGFSLVEMIVAVGLFTVVMLIAVTSLLALINANRKARTLQSVVNNLNVALDGMVRSLRMGQNYACDRDDPLEGPNSCPDGGTKISFIAFNDDIVKYEWDQSTNRILIRRNNDPPAYLTSPEVDISDMSFYVVGTTPGDEYQPKVVIIMKGSAGGDDVRTRTTFSIQSTAVQRIPDL